MIITKYFVWTNTRPYSWTPEQTTTLTQNKRQHSLTIVFTTQRFVLSTSRERTELWMAARSTFFRGCTKHELKRSKVSKSIPHAWWREKSSPVCPTCMNRQPLLIELPAIILLAFFVHRHINSEEPVNVVHPLIEGGDVKPSGRFPPEFYTAVYLA